MKDLVFNLKLRLFNFYSIFQLNKVVTLISILVLLLFLGSLYLHFAETYFTGGNAIPSFATVPESVWSIFVYFFSGLEDDYEPQTWPGKIGAVFIMIVSVGIIGVFTGNIAAILFERSRNKSFMKHKPKKLRFKGHIIIFGWSHTAFNVIKLLMANNLSRDRIFVVIDEQTRITIDSEGMPYHLYHVQGDYTKEDVLQTADFDKCYKSVLISSENDINNDRLLLASYTAWTLNKDCYITVMTSNNTNERFLARYADEIISNDSMVSRLISQSILSMGLNRVYGILMGTAEGSPDLAFLSTPKSLTGKSYRDVLSLMDSMFLEQSIAAIGYFNRKTKKIVINPKSLEKDVIMDKSYKLIVLKRK